MGRQSHKAIERIKKIASMSEADAKAYLRSEKDAKPESVAPVRSSDRVVPLPEHIQKHLDEINARDKQIGFEADPLVSEHMAWRRWGKAKTNEELFDLLIALRNYLYTAADCEGGIILEECAWRIKRHNSVLDQQSAKTKHTTK